MVKQKITVVSCTCLVRNVVASSQFSHMKKLGFTHSRAELQTEGEILTAIVIQMLILF